GVHVWTARQYTTGGIVEKYQSDVRKFPGSCQDYCALLRSSPRCTDQGGRSYRHTGAALEEQPPCPAPGRLSHGIGNTIDAYQRGRGYGYHLHQADQHLCRWRTWGSGSVRTPILDRKSTKKLMQEIKIRVVDQQRGSWRAKP